MKSAILGALVCAASAHAQTAKLTALPSGWDTSHAGEPLPSSALHGFAYGVKPGYRSIGADGSTSGVDFYAPIHTKLGTGALAQPDDSKAITFPRGGGMDLNTLNPSSSGAGGTDVNLETEDNHGHGFRMSNGYWEVGAVEPTAHGSHAGIWFLTDQDANGHGEIDFPEDYGAADKACSMAHHYWPTKASRFEGQPHASYYWGCSAAGGSGMPVYGVAHAYGVLFTPTEIYAYVDRKEIARTPRMAEEAGAWHLLLSVFTDANRKDGYEPATLHIWNVYAWGK